MAVLVGKKPEDTTVLSEREYEIAQNAVELDRTPNDPEADAIAHTIGKAKRGWYEKWNAIENDGTLRWFLRDLLQRLGSDDEDVIGMVVRSDDKPIWLREEEGSRRLECIVNLLQILDAGGWLGDEVPVFLQLWAKKMPTPAQAMWFFSERAENFDSEIEHAKKLMALWPEKFAAEKKEAAHA